MSDTPSSADTSFSADILADPDVLTARLRVRPGTDVDLANYPTRLDVSGKAAKPVIAANAEAISELAYRLYAEGERKVLIVLQGMDTSGKDGTTAALFARTPPLNVDVAAFKAPTKRELAHDFLWRVHREVPGAGRITVFNRSHYEDVLVARVRGLSPPDVIEQRYTQINDFERLLAESGTTVLKFMLHISRDAQAESLRERLTDPEKFWKFNPGDLDDRALWPDFMEAYRIMLERTSTPHAPWHVIPSDKGKARKAAIGTLVRAALEKMDPQFPEQRYTLADYGDAI